MGDVRNTTISFVLQCLYRHSELALSADRVCSDWNNKQCLNYKCPLRHPGKYDYRHDSHSSSNDDCMVPTIGAGETENKGAKQDYRPLTDCFFYIQEKHCKNGDSVRVNSAHSTLAINLLHIILV